MSKETDACVRRAALYPYDNRLGGGKSYTAARAILADLTDRGGIKHALDDVDMCTREHIVDALSDIIKQVYEENKT